MVSLLRGLLDVGHGEGEVLGVGGDDRLGSRPRFYRTL